MLISEYIKADRKEKGLNIRDYAEMHGLSRTRISQIENGSVDKPTLRMAEMLCKTFDIDPDTLCRMIPGRKREFAENLVNRLDHTDPKEACKKCIKEFYEKYQYDRYLTGELNEKCQDDQVVFYNDQSLDDNCMAFWFSDLRFPDSKETYDAIANYEWCELEPFDYESGVSVLSRYTKSEEVAFYYLPPRKEGARRAQDPFVRTFSTNLLRILNEDYRGPKHIIFITQSMSLYSDISSLYSNLILQDLTCEKEEEEREVYLAFSCGKKSSLDASLVEHVRILYINSKKRY